MSADVMFAEGLDIAFQQGLNMWEATQYAWCYVIEWAEEQLSNGEKYKELFVDLIKLSGEWKTDVEPKDDGL